MTTTVLPKLDGKFSGVIFKVKNGVIVPDDEYVVFLAKDTCFASTLLFYHDECVRLGADNEQIESVKRMTVRVNNWRHTYPDRCKVPDAKYEKLLG